MSTLVNYEREGRVAVLTMDDGKRNALGFEMLAAIGAALDRARDDGATVILAGREGAFSAGFDLRVLTAGGEPAYRLLIAGFELAERLLAFPTPVVVASSGHTLAMGAFLALAGDYRIGAVGPHKVGTNEVAIGLVMPYFGIEMCRQRLTPAYFHRSVINAEIYSPEEAVAAGFFDRVVAPGELMTTAKSVAGQVAGLNVAVHYATKLRTREHCLKAIRQAIEADAVALATLFGVTVSK